MVTSGRTSPLCRRKSRVVNAGVDWVDDVVIDGDGDRVLIGPTTLPRPGVIDGVVNEQ